MSALERLLKRIPYIRRPLFQRDAARAQLTAVLDELAGVSAESSSVVRQRFPEPAWFLLADDDERQDELIGDFREYVARAIPKGAAVAEIGPSFSPIVPKVAGYQVTVVDHLDQPQLVEKYTPHGVDTSKIEPVDIIWHGGMIADATGSNRFEAVVAAHVIEHAPDFINFLNDCAAILKDHGSLFLIVPDKRYSFDFMQPVSDVAKILGDHRAKRVRHSFESHYRLTACVRNGDRLAWDQSGLSRVSFVHGDPVHMRSVAEQSAAVDSYVDAHENYFTPVSFAMIVDELRQLREIALDVEVLTRSRGPEFLAVLRKRDSTTTMPTEKYLDRKMAAYALLMREQLEQIRSVRSLLSERSTASRR